MSSQDMYQPIFHVGNKHAQDSGKPPHIDGNIRKRYHGYFENEFGEQAIFVYDYEVKEGTLYMGDAGWERALRLSALAYRSLNWAETSLALQLLDNRNWRNPKVSNFSENKEDYDVSNARE